MIDKTVVWTIGITSAAMVLVYAITSFSPNDRQVITDQISFHDYVDLDEYCEDMGLGLALGVSTETPYSYVDTAICMDGYGLRPVEETVNGVNVRGPWLIGATAGIEEYQIAWDAFETDPHVMITIVRNEIKQVCPRDAMRVIMVLMSSSQTVSVTEYPLCYNANEETLTVYIGETAMDVWHNFTPAFLL